MRGPSPSHKPCKGEAASWREICRFAALRSAGAGSSPPVGCLGMLHEQEHVEVGEAFAKVCRIRHGGSALARQRAPHPPETQTLRARAVRRRTMRERFQGCRLAESDRRSSGAPLITHGGPGTSFRGRLVALCRCGTGCYSNPCIMMNSGANVSDTMVIRLMRMFMDGPDVSLKGSPTVSPTTAALWASEPLPP